MRELLFRGKRIDDGEWTYGYLFVLGKGTEFEETYILGDLDHRESVYDIWKCAERVDPETIGQWTGWTAAMNDQKIFEGDIVVVYDSETGSDYDDPGVVKYHINSCGYIEQHKNWIGCLETVPYEVIGNIHDNPELLEVE